MQKLHFVRQTTLLLAAMFTTVGLLAEQANAGIMIDIADDGNDLVVNVSGSFNYGTFSNFVNIGTVAGLVGAGNLPVFQYIVSNNLQAIPLSQGVLDQSNWSSSGLFSENGSALLTLSNVTGETFGGWRIDSGNLVTPKDYVSGTEWVSSARVVAPVTLRPQSGSYVTFTLTETGDTVTMRYNSSFSPDTTSGTSDGVVPEPSTAIAMGLLGIVGVAGNRRRRRQDSVA